MRAVKELIGTRIAAFINAPNKNYEPLVCGLDRVDFKPADVILVSNNKRRAVKWTTMSELTPP